MKKIIIVFTALILSVAFLSSCSAVDWLTAQAEEKETEAEETTYKEGTRYTKKVEGIEDFDENDQFIAKSSENRYVYINVFRDGYKVYKFNTQGTVYEIEEVTLYDDMTAALEAYQAGINDWTEDEAILRAELHNCCIVFVVNPMNSDMYKARFNMTKEQLEADEEAADKQ